MADSDSNRLRLPLTTKDAAVQPGKRQDFFLLSPASSVVGFVMITGHAPSGF
jgi:hypothetical protein